jgi:hypothetical protein
VSVAVVIRHLALAATAASWSCIAAAGDDIPTRIERIDNPGYSEINISRWASAGPADLGWGVGNISLADRPASATPTLMLGLRYRASEHAALFADATHVRGIGLNGEDQLLSKVGVEFKAAQSRLNLAYGGGLGLRLAGDARMTLKARRGGLELTMRRTF